MLPERFHYTLNKSGVVVYLVFILNYLFKKRIINKTYHCDICILVVSVFIPDGSKSSGKLEMTGYYGSGIPLTYKGFCTSEGNVALKN